VLDYLHRGKALAEWHKLSRGEDIPLERALGSFDMFVLHDQHGDLQEVAFNNSFARTEINSRYRYQISLTT
jgi:hypothetical protein